MSPGNRPCRSPTSADHSRALGGGKGEVELGPSCISWPPRLRPGSILVAWVQEEGGARWFRSGTRSHLSQFHTKMHNRGGNTYLNLQPPATLACCGWILVSSAPGSLGLPGPERRSILFLPSGSAEVSTCLRTKEKTRKDGKTHIRPLCWGLVDAGHYQPYQRET